jgi:hypothetical protein
MSKHHVICKSKTLDVPIIITSSIGDSGTTGEGVYFNETTSTHETTTATTNLVTSSQMVMSSNNNNSSKLNKGYSLDSKYMMTTQNSLSSSSTNNDMTSSSNSVSSCSTNSIQPQHYHSRQFLLPPPTPIDLLQTSNINGADFEANKYSMCHASK